MSAVVATKAEEVKDALSLCRWASSAYGVPPPTKTDIMTLNKKARELFEQNPGTDWQTIVMVVKWSHSKKRRFGRIWAYLGQYRFAWADGVFDFVPQDSDLDVAVRDALESEEDPVWRGRLLRSAGEARAAVLEEWRSKRSTT